MADIGGKFKTIYLLNSRELVSHYIMFFVNGNLNYVNTYWIIGHKGTL